MKSILYISILLSLLKGMSLESESKEVHSLEGHHLCTKIISYDEDIIVPKTKLEKYEIKYWCMKIPPICTTHKYKLVTENKTITLKKSKIGYDCCRGYKKDEKTCVPVCTLGCNHGECVEPEVCTCNEGWRGHNCSEECHSNAYGQDCKKNCICENGGWCDIKTGVCYCPEGYIGDHCELECQEGWYGINCESKCKCRNDALCFIENGFCQCQPGYYGLYCEHKCEPGFHGNYCYNICACEKDTTEICHHEDGRCICKPGYTGKFCQNECTNMTYGVGCAKHCRCEHAHFCEPTTGKCLCDIGWLGERCSEKCPEGYFGDGCKDKCLKCNNEGSVCNHVTGACDCSPGYYGNNCEITCPGNFWGSSCRNFCNCSVNSTCDSKTGDCKCKAGWTGENCSKQCSSNFWGLHCSNECNCLENEICDAVDGKCSCEAGWIGENCSTPCPGGKYGLDCKYECPCPLGDTCHKNNGSCIVVLMTPGFKPAHILLALIPIIMIIGAGLYIYFLQPIILQKLHCSKRSSSIQELRTSEESIGVHFRNPLYCNVELSKETDFNNSITNPTERSISFVNILSSVRASMKERASSCDSGLESGAGLKRSSKVSNLSSGSASSNVDKEPDKPFSISDVLDDDFAPEHLNDFNTAENITGEKGEESTIDSAKNK